MKIHALCRVVIVALAFSLLAAGVTEAHEDHGIPQKNIFTKHFQGTLFDITDHAAYSVEVLLNDELHQKDDAQPDEETENEGRGQESRLPPRSGDLPQLRAQSAHSL